MDPITNGNVPFINTFLRLKMLQRHLDICKVCVYGVYVYKDLCILLSKDSFGIIVEITLDNYLLKQPSNSCTTS